MHGGAREAKAKAKCMCRFVKEDINMTTRALKVFYIQTNLAIYTIQVQIV